MTSLRIEDERLLTNLSKGWGDRLSYLPAQKPMRFFAPEIKVEPTALIVRLLPMDTI
jgi:hypothetical protein